MPSDTHKKLLQQHLELSWNKGRLALAEQLHSPDFLYRSSVFNSPLDSAGFNALILNIREVVPDVQVILEECVAEGFKAATWCTIIGTVTKPILGLEPSDKVLSIASMAFWTFTSNHLIREISVLFDVHSLHRQLGLSPSAISSQYTLSVPAHTKA